MMTAMTRRLLFALRRSIAVKLTLTLVGFVAYVWLLRNAPTSLVATYAYVNPVIAVALGAVFLGEEITGQMLVAGAVIIGSVALIVRKSGEALEPGRGLRRRAIPVLEGDLQGK